MDIKEFFEQSAGKMVFPTYQSPSRLSSKAESGKSIITIEMLAADAPEGR
jgi:hypothetical protein